MTRQPQKQGSFMSTSCDLIGLGEGGGNRAKECCSGLHRVDTTGVLQNGHLTTEMAPEKKDRCYQGCSLAHGNPDADGPPPVSIIGLSM